jgi:hypothetical protein
MALVGSSPFTGDMSNTGIVLPANPTPSQDRRYLCLTCGLQIPREEVAVVSSIEQLLTIGAFVDVGDPEEDPTQYPLEIPVEDPTWSFVDGNVSWHLRRVTVTQAARTIYDDFLFFPPYSSNAIATTPSILTRVPTLGAYQPLNAGQPFGDPVDDLGTFRDMRFPWSQRDQNLNMVVSGPCYLMLYASVRQTDPDTRVQPPVTIDGTYLRREDRFLLNNPTARYWRVGARMIVDVFSKWEKWERKCTS